jgi:hypothetical protein
MSQYTDHLPKAVQQVHTDPERAIYLQQDNNAAGGDV